MDYASKLNAMAGASQPPQGQGLYQLMLQPGAQLTPEQASIMESILSLYNNPATVANAKARAK